ncbi:a6244da9-0d46-4a8e-8f6a-7bfb3e16f0e8 [Thermothielavioides terrestris]|uniref:A6244da9-0d46-4a8e-8f6a-7bfb3e16f0e8 n=1 Tax=Thermothielavioides terrestris TaxID=2587410 RepID=A0A3S4D7C3_9PEZI|nr:a6244da9-0d46-4a8e-8f6a-7bfb3e16f0e8 [Thermothielavioides terrestris]
MSGTKSLLKAINEAIRQQRWDDAIEAAEDTHLLAFALDKKNLPDKAERTYMTATGLKPSDPQAWQGLIKLYQQRRAQKLASYQHAVLNLAQIYRDADEMYKCQDVVDKFIDYARTHGKREQYVDALDLILPESPIYPALEGRVPHPAKTYEIQAQIIEADEKKRINTLIGDRRTRIGARVSEVTLEVKREVYQQSRLDHVYRQLIDWATDDDVRRKYEEKLLQYCYERLLAWPPGEQKDREAAIVRKLANDMVIIRHPFKFAWDIAINWQDHKDIQDWDVTVLRQYCTFFPDSDLSRVIMAFLTSDISPFPKEEAPKQPVTGARAETEDESEDDEEGGVPTTYVPLTEEDRLLMMMEGGSSADSLFALRLAGEYYQHIEEHENNVELMRKALEHVRLERSRTGLSFRNSEDAFSLCLGTALVFYQSPRHHQEAKSLFDGVLAHEPSSTRAMIGVGLIYEEEEEYSEAIDFLERALQRDPDNLRVRTEAAWVKALKGDFETSRRELESCLPLLSKKGQTNKELLAQTQYRVGYCLWNLETSRAARKNRAGAYAYFLEALKSNLNYAPAYTSLGVYYADYAKDKKRARRCFQKALELSPSEVTAAERLARSFADDGDWDRVELVAQRVVDSGKVKPPPGSKRKGISWPFAALGVAELNKQDYRKAIVSFQAALRISPEDYHSWVGLGESYHGSGRYIAATKAILNAQKLEAAVDGSISEGTWFSKFILAEIKRELGEFDEAIALYREIVASRPDEEGVAIALMQAIVDSARDSLDKGFFGKAVDLAVETLKFADQAPGTIKETFNYWKAVADACSLFSSVQGRLAEFPVDLVQQLLGANNSALEQVVDVDGVGSGITNGLSSEASQIGPDLTRVLHATILAHKRVIHVSANDVHAQAVAYYNLGWAEYRAHMCLPMQSRRKATKYLKAAIACFKRAIELEAGNSEFWNALGVATSGVNPAVSQHSFVRSLYLNEGGAHAWTNLGTLALLQGDVQFANEAFTKAQSADPDYAHAWLGQGLVALLLGDRKEARGLFTHAMDISESSSLATRRHYAVSMFDHIMESPSDVPVASLIQPILALSQLQGLNPQELAYGHLSALFQERNLEHDRAVATLEKLCAALEADYEVSESPESLKRFAIAKADLARAYLAAGSNAEAVEAAELAIQLSSDESDSELSADERRRVRLSAHVTMGLARYYQQGGGGVDEAVACFDSAIEESDGDPDVACVLAQVLWATGKEEARERAREVLFGVIERVPHHVQSVLLLGVIALLDEDDESLEAVVAELQALRASDEGVSPADQRRLGEVLRAVAAAGKGGGVVDDAEELKAHQARADVMFHPHLPHGWSELGALGGEEGKSAAEMALRVALKGVAPRGDLAAEELARAYAGTGRAVDAQTAIMVAPWEKAGWMALGEVIKG